MARPAPLAAPVRAPVTLEDLRARRDEITRIVEAHRATNVRVFGSVARGEATAASDVDFLIDALPGHTFGDREAIADELEALLGVPVDVSAAAALRERARRYVLADAVDLSSARVRERPPGAPRFNRDRERLLDVLDAVGQIEPHVARGREVFFDDALVRTFITYWIAGAGEAVKGLSADLRTRHAEVDWRRATGMRDVISHNYRGLDLDRVWDTAQAFMPVLKAAVERILATDPGVRE